jgi:hypothetical protein
VTFVCAWALILIFWASIAAVVSLQALIGFIAGVIVVIATSLAVWLAAASTYDRDNRGDGWDP